MIALECFWFDFFAPSLSIICSQLDAIRSLCAASGFHGGFSLADRKCFTCELDSIVFKLISISRNCRTKRQISSRIVWIMDSFFSSFILSLPLFSVLCSFSLQEMLFTLSALAAYSPESNQFSLRLHGCNVFGWLLLGLVVLKNWRAVIRIFGFFFLRFAYVSYSWCWWRLKSEVLLHNSWHFHITISTLRLMKYSRTFWEKSQIVNHAPKFGIR